MKMRKFLAIAMVIVFLIILFLVGTSVYGQTPTPTATPELSSSPGPSVAQVETPIPAIVTPKAIVVSQESVYRAKPKDLPPLSINGNGVDNQKSDPCSIDFNLEAGVNTDYDGMDVGARFFPHSVANSSGTFEFCGNKKVSFGIYNWTQVSITKKNPNEATEHDLGGYVNVKLPKDFSVGVDVAKYFVEGGSINNFSFAVSKSVPLKYEFEMEVLNETSVYTVSKGLGFRGGVVNKTSFPISRDFGGVFKATLTPAFSFDNNPFDLGPKGKLASMGFITMRVDVPITKNFSVFGVGGTYFRLFGQTDRTAKVFGGVGISYTIKLR